MSKYSLALGRAIVESLCSVAAAQPAQIAGYWANRDFWLVEFRHLVTVASEYEERVKRMAEAFENFSIIRGGKTHNKDDCDQEYQTVRYTTTKGERKNAVGEVRTALVNLADRALDLGIIGSAAYEEFLDQLRAVRLD